MRTIFALFEGYMEAKRAVDELISREFDEEEVNVIVQEFTARSDMDVNFRTMNADKSAKLHGKDLKGIDGLLAGRRPTSVPGAGNVYAAGKTASIVIKTAANERSGPAGLRQALVDFDVPGEAAGFYSEGVADGGVLVWVRTEDERAAELANILSSTKGEEVANYS
jgi:hypothetical protein